MSALGVVGLGAVAAPALARALGQPSKPPLPADPSRPVSPLPAPDRMPQPPTSPVNPGPGGPGGGGPLSPLSPEQLGWDPAKREFVLPKLPYAVDALEPHIDKETMTIHREKHHDAYVKGVNNALKKLADIRDNQGDVSLLKHWSRELNFHLSGHVNHALFWATMAPPGAGGGGAPLPGTDFTRALERDFGSFEKFTAHFKTAAQQVEGGGWAFLVHHRDTDLLMVMQAEKQQLMAIGAYTPILGVDVWEHAYYLKYKWNRKEYVDAFFNVINWPRVSELYARARR